MMLAIIDFDVDRLGHESTDVFALAMLRIQYRHCIIIIISGFESYNSAFDILNSKRLLQRGAEFHAHSMMPKNRCWETLRG